MTLDEPRVELELHDRERVLVRVFVRGRGRPLEMVLADEALRALSRRRVSLRCEEALAAHEDA